MVSTLKPAPETHLTFVAFLSLVLVFAAYTGSDAFSILGNYVNEITLPSAGYIYSRCTVRQKQLGGSVSASLPEQNNVFSLPDFLSSLYFLFFSSSSSFLAVSRFSLHISIEAPSLTGSWLCLFV